MVGWLGTAALAGIGGLASQRKWWNQVPYLGAIAAVVVFVNWRFSQNWIDNEVEKERAVGSKDNVVIVDENLGPGLEPGFRDEESEVRTPGSTETILDPRELPDFGAFHVERKRTIGVPNGILPVNQSVLHPLDVPHDGAGTKLKEHVNTPNFKDVTKDPLLSDTDSLKRERSPIETCVLSVEAEEGPAVVAAFREAPNPNPSGELNFHDAEGTLQSTQVVQNVKNLPEIPESLLFSIVIPQVDKNVDAITESHADANNMMSDLFSMLSVRTCKPNRVFLADGSDLPNTGEQKVSEDIIKSPSSTDPGKKLEDEINMPQQEGYRTDEDGECPTPRCTSAVLQVDPTDLGHSLRGSEDWKPQKPVVVSTAKAMEQFLPVREPCYTEFDDENTAQSPSSVINIPIDTKGMMDELSNSTRREYAERLRSYDEYLADPELSPTMRSQVLRARASVAMYFDDSDDDQ